MNKRAKRIKDLHDIPFFIMPIAITIMVILVHFLYITTIQKRSTYSIVAVDPVTGDVGAAGASCVPISASFLAVLAPGQGAGAIQAAGTPANQAKVFDLLRQGATSR